MRRRNSLRQSKHGGRACATGWLVDIGCKRRVKCSWPSCSCVELYSARRVLVATAQQEHNSTVPSLV
jgi:hypothetical protein